MVPFLPGDFVWTNFPFEADPNNPGVVTPLS
jgi:hypothetical protein